MIVYVLLLALWTVIWGFRVHWRLDGGLYIAGFLTFCGIISTVYMVQVMKINAVTYPYEHITVAPLIFLVVCYMITSAPVMAFDIHGQNAIINSESQRKVIKWAAIFFIAVAFEPFLECLRNIGMVTNSSELADMYSERTDLNETTEILSGIGRKLYRIVFSFSLLYPVMLFYFLSQKKINYWIVAGLLMVILCMWLRNLEIAGRSQVVQSVLYLVAVYFIMRRFIDKKVNRRIMIYGLTFLAFAVIAVGVVSIARFSENEYMGDDVSIWVWLGLYAGEGPLNFACMTWDVTKSSHGVLSFSMPAYLLGIVGKLPTAAVIWDATGRLGLVDNIFYTYVGNFFGDFGAVGTIFVLLAISLVTWCFARPNKNHEYSFSKIALICFLARIVVIPTFYTYGGWFEELELAFCLLICGILALWGKVKAS